MSVVALMTRDDVSTSALFGVSLGRHVYYEGKSKSSSCFELNFCTMTFKCMDKKEEASSLATCHCVRAIASFGQSPPSKVETASLASFILLNQIMVDDRPDQCSFLECGVFGCNYQCYRQEGVYEPYDPSCAINCCDKNLCR
jgi:hypothetical protein